LTEDSLKQSDNSYMTTREKHLHIAPYLPFDSDLKFWESDMIEIAPSYKSDSLHRFWKTNEHQESFVPSAVEASMRERSFRLESKFEPVRRKCGALLPSGRFCQRMDRKVCPFHGKIVERDASGTPLHVEDIQRVSRVVSFNGIHTLKPLKIDEIICIVNIIYILLLLKVKRRA